jgi:Zn-finger nucleic acid-binding protein
MVCPVCSEAMVAYEWEGVEIDSCAVCGGVWLDAGEVEVIAELAGVDRGAVSGALVRANGPVDGKRRCPRCREKLRTMTVGGGRSVELDACPEHHGLWFDRGEVRDFITSFDTGESGAVADYLAAIFGKGDGRDNAPDE